MKEIIKGIARVKSHPGKVEEWIRLSAEAVVFERDNDAATKHFANISHLLEPLMATAIVTGELLGTPNAMMREKLAKFAERGPKRFTPWMAIQDRDWPSDRRAP